MNKERIKSIVDAVLDCLFYSRRFEASLSRYQGYRPNSIERWKRQTGLSRLTVSKLLKNIQFFDRERVSRLIHNLAIREQALFQSPSFFITSFGRSGKSGPLVLYEFTHSLSLEPKVKETWEISKLPENSTILFVEDMIGTGSQSVEYIDQKLNKILQPSHKPVLFAICGTPDGIKHVEKYSNFRVLCGEELPLELFSHYRSESPVFSSREKLRLERLNDLVGQSAYDLGLLVAFPHNVPDNTMPILWKDGASYREGEIQRKWFALLPRVVAK